MSQTIPTPKYSHLSSRDFECVYEPAEDSFLLLDAIENQLETIRDLKPTICVEIGPGSGIISAGIGSVLKASTFIIACDINPKACSSTSQTLIENDVSHCDVLQSDCLQGTTDRLSGNVDLLICNPPYVETPNCEEGNADIRASWAGGERGLTLTNRLLTLLPKLLTKKGFALIVLEQCNKPAELLCESESKFGLKSSVVVKRRAGRELLSVVKFYRQ